MLFKNYSKNKVSIIENLSYGFYYIKIYAYYKFKKIKLKS